MEAATTLGLFTNSRRTAVATPSCAPLEFRAATGVSRLAVWLRRAAPRCVARLLERKPELAAPFTGSTKTAATTGSCTALPASRAKAKTRNAHSRSERTEQCTARQKREAPTR